MTHLLASGLTIDLPSWRIVARQAGRHLLENILAPLGVFYAVLAIVDLRGAFIGALCWCYAAILLRLVRRQPVPALLLVSAVLLTARSAVGLATGSAFLYFLQPSLGNFVIGALFLLSVPVGHPLAARLAGDFCTFPPGLVGHHGLRRFFRRVSLLWAFVFCVNGAVTVWMLVSIPIAQFLAVTTGTSTGMIVLAAGLSFLWFRRSLRGAGVRLRLGVSPAGSLPG